MTKDGRISARERRTLERALEILSEWTERVELERGEEAWDDYAYSNAAAAVAGLGEFLYAHDLT